MQKIRSLSVYAKIILIVLAVMLLVFSVLYPVCLSRTGFAYRGAILKRTQKDGVTTYSGRVQGKETVFTVYPDRSLEYRRGDAAFGPYNVRETPDAVAEDLPRAPDVIGVELRMGTRIVFRGAMLSQSAPGRWLYNTDGSHFSVPGFPNTRNQGGSALNEEEPLPAVVLDLMYGPGLTHNGDITGWIFGFLLCIFTAVSVLYADELFRLRMSLRLRNADGVEPSELVHAGRYIGWTVSTGAALLLFIMGLLEKPG